MSEALEKHRRLIVYVTGWVQGVGFRWYVIQKVRPLDLTGYVRNLPDGRVQVVAEGSPEHLEKLLTIVRTGPPSSRVYGVEETWHEPEGKFSGFDVRY